MDLWIFQNKKETEEEHEDSQKSWNETVKQKKQTSTTWRNNSENKNLSLEKRNDQKTCRRNLTQVSGGEDLMSLGKQELMDKSQTSTQIDISTNNADNTKNITNNNTNINNTMFPLTAQTWQTDTERQTGCWAAVRTKRWFVSGVKMHGFSSCQPYQTPPPCLWGRL